MRAAHHTRTFITHTHAAPPTRHNHHGVHPLCTSPYLNRDVSCTILPATLHGDRVRFTGWCHPSGLVHRVGRPMTSPIANPCNRLRSSVSRPRSAISRLIGSHSGLRDAVTSLGWLGWLLAARWEPGYRYGSTGISFYVENVTPSGEKFYTNDSQRLCSQSRCSYLSLTKLERMDGKPSLLVYPFCSRFCQLQFSNDCLRLARTTTDKRRFLFPHATHEKRNSARVWLNHKRRFAMEQKERECIANAFESYSHW
jgi:hypothetical protein